MLEEDEFEELLDVPSTLDDEDDEEEEELGVGEALDEDELLELLEESSKGEGRLLRLTELEVSPSKGSGMLLKSSELSDDELLLDVSSKGRGILLKLTETSDDELLSELNSLLAVLLLCASLAWLLSDAEEFSLLWSPVVAGRLRKLTGFRTISTIRNRNRQPMTLRRILFMGVFFGLKPSGNHTRKHASLPLP